jgi:hypothetical protein
MTAMLLIAFAMASIFTNPASFFVSARLLAIRGSSDTVPLPSLFCVDRLGSFLSRSACFRKDRNFRLVNVLPL